MFQPFIRFFAREGQDMFGTGNGPGDQLAVLLLL
jgi:hypothetical protein